MKYNSIEAFVPSGKDFQSSRQLFLELGFNILWETNDYVGFENNGCRFILQKYDEKSFAENFMLSVKVDDLDEFWRENQQTESTRKIWRKVERTDQFPMGQRG